MDYIKFGVRYIRFYSVHLFDRVKESPLLRHVSHVSICGKDYLRKVSPKLCQELRDHLREAIPMVTEYL